MKNNKLLNLLETLSPKEFKQLKDYASSPFFFKNRPDILALYQALKNHYPEFEEASVAKEVIFKKVYGKQLYNDKKFRQLQSDFVKIIENYLLFLENEADRFEKQKRLVAIYGKRNAYEEFTKGTTKLIKSLDEAPYQDAKFHYDTYILESEYYFHPKTENRTEIQRLVKSLKNFESFFVLERAKLGIDFKNRERIFKENYSFKIDDFTQLIPKDNLIYQLYETSLKLLETNKEAGFLKLNRIYLKSIDNLGKNDSLIFFKILQNFTIQQYNKNKAKYSRILLDLYKLGINKQILFANDKIKGAIFLNIIGIGLNNGEVDWVESIIEDYKDKIAEEKEDFTYNLSTALLAFHEKDFAKVIDILNTTTFPYTLNHYGFKTLIIRAAFKAFPKDSSYFKIFIKHCLSFEKFLTRDDLIITEKVEMHLNFTKFIKKMGQCIFKQKWTSNKKLEFELELDQNPKITYKYWLKETINKI